MEALQIAIFSLWLCWVIVKDVLSPLVKYVLGRKPKDDIPADVETVRESANQGRFRVLEIRLDTVQAQIIDLGERLDQQAAKTEETAISLDNKLDLVLAELKGFREQTAVRLSVLETHVSNLLNARPARIKGGD